MTVVTVYINKLYELAYVLVSAYPNSATIWERFFEASKRAQANDFKGRDSVTVWFSKECHMY
jgi:hypothetical protein